jgi:hypothetical protein
MIPDRYLGVSRHGTILPPPSATHAREPAP